MNVRIQLIAAGIRLLADNTSLINRPVGFESLLEEIFETDPYDIRLARKIDAELSRAVAFARRTKTNHDFKKIVQNV